MGNKGDVMKFYKKFSLLAIVFSLLLGINLFASKDSNTSIDFSYNQKIYGASQIEAIKNWGINSPTSGVVNSSVMDMNGVSINALKSGEKITGIRGISGLGELFMILQHKFFAPIFLGIIILVIAVFFTHYKIVGVKKFNHTGKKFKVFSKYNIIIHWGTAIPFMVICITGLMMIFGDKLGGGMPIRIAKNIHFMATFVFIIFGILMFLMWIKASLFKLYDIKWLMIMGGYLSHSKDPVEAGKFNAGQKMWFYLATIGGFVMATTGLIMHFFYGDINFLRLNAIIHNILGFGIIAMLITHIYMAVFAIEGALDSILNGHMGEEELAIMHKHYYEELIRG